GTTLPLAGTGGKSSRLKPRQVSRPRASRNVTGDATAQRTIHSRKDYLTTITGPGRLRIDPEEVAEWVESFDQMMAVSGAGDHGRRAHALAQRAATAGVAADPAVTTDYVNTIPA